MKKLILILLLALTLCGCGASSGPAAHARTLDELSGAVDKLNDRIGRAIEGAEDIYPDSRD